MSTFASTVEVDGNVAATADSFDEASGNGIPALVRGATTEELIEASMAADCAILESDRI